MLRKIGQVLVAVLFVAAAVAVLVASPLARPAVGMLPSFAAMLPALILASC